MKKRITFFLLVSITVMTGCGSEKLTCIKDEETTKDMWVKQEVAMSFDQDKIALATITREVKVAGEFVKTIDVLEKSLKEEFINFKDKAVKVKAKRKGNTINIKAKANYKKMKKETKISFGAAPYDKNKKQMKKYFEDQGFTCK